MGVDANVITAERIREELGKKKTLDGALTNGFKMGLSPIIDGNVTIVIVAAILMGAFGPTDGFWAKVFTPVFGWFGPSTAGTIYSFGFTLLTSVLLNFVFGVFATRVMLRGASGIKALRNPWLYGGAKTGENPRPTRFRTSTCGQPQEVLHLLLRAHRRCPGVQPDFRRVYGR